MLEIGVLIWILIMVSGISLIIFKHREDKNE
jgi:hypothetical protein